MKEFLRSKIIISLSLFGFILSFILGIISRMNIISLISKSFISTTIMAIIGIIIHIFLKNNLVPEDFEIFLIGSNNVITENKIETEKNVDLVEGENIPYEDIYKKDEEVSYNNLTEEDNSNIDNHKILDESENKIENEINTNTFKENLNTSGVSYNFNSSVSNKEVKDASIKSVGDNIQIKVNNRVLNVDPKTVAKAIKTVLHKE